MATMNISLPDPLRDWVDAQVATGRFGNASDYVRDLIRHDQEKEAARDKLQKLVDDALASGVTTLDREGLLARVRASVDAALVARKAS